MRKVKRITIAALVLIVGMSAWLFVPRAPNTKAKVSAPAARASIAIREAAIDAEPDLERLRRENERLRQALDLIASKAGNSVPEKVARLRDLMARLADQAVPELALATEDDWYASVDGPFDSVEDYRAAFSILRGRAEKRFATKALDALRKYSAEHSEFPSSASDLGPYVDPVVTSEMLARYKVAPAHEVPFVKMGGDRILTSVSRVDSEYDWYIAIGPHGFGTSSRNPQDQALIEPSVGAYKAANPGVMLPNPAALLPYTRTAQERAAVERLVRSIDRH